MRSRQIVSTVVVVAAVLMLVQVCLAQTVVDMDFKEAPLSDVFQVLGELAGYNVLIDPSVTGTISFYLKDMTVTEALDLLIQATGYDYRIVNNTMVVASQARLAERFQSNDSAFVALKNVSAADASRLLGIVAPGVKTYIDSELNILVLFGAAADLDFARQVLEKYDSIRSGSVQLELESATGLINHKIFVDDAREVEIYLAGKKQYPAGQSEDE